MLSDPDEEQYYLITVLFWSLTLSSAFGTVYALCRHWTYCLIPLHDRPLLNTLMRNLNALAEENLRIDAELLESLKRLGVIANQYGLSRLCGMNESYYSSMRAKGYGMTLGSIVILWACLAQRAREVSEPRVGAVLSHAAGLVQNAVNEKCRLRAHQIGESRRR